MKTRLVLILALVTSCVAGARLCAQTALAVRGAFVYNVLNFVEWPATVLPPGNTPLRVVVVAPGPQPQFEAALAGRSIKGHPLVVETVHDPERIDDAHVVFITADAVSLLRPVLRRIDGRAILTLTEQSLDTPVDTIVALGIKDAKLAFSVNLDLADDVGLQIAPNLLKLAKNVKTSRGKR